LPIKSKALEANIATYHVEVEISPAYELLQEIMSEYYGIMEGFTTFLKELSHPYKNWEFIVAEAKTYALSYFHLVKRHPEGCRAAQLYVDIFHAALASDTPLSVKAEAVDNLLLYLQKIIREAKDRSADFKPVLQQIFRTVRGCPDEVFFLFVKSFYQLKRITETLLATWPSESIDFRRLNRLLIRYFQHTYAYWLARRDPQTWFESEAPGFENGMQWDQVFAEISHARYRNWQRELTDILETGDVSQRQTCERLIALSGYGDIVDSYRRMPQQLLRTGAKKSKRNHWKVIFLSLILNFSGLSILHEEALRDMNRTLGWLIDHESHFNIRKLIEKTFVVLNEQAAKFPLTALNCVLNMGKGIYRTDDSDLINYFIDNVIDLGFQSPMVSGVGDDWQVRVNPAHIQNIRTWLDLIELNPKRSIRLMSCLVIYLTLGGVYIKDTDLFPRDITRLLNSRIGPVYNLIKQLARLFPVYFNDIGAEGSLRDISTRIDELSNRKDILVHFLRKQSHVESSNLIIGFMEAVLNFWETRDKTVLQPFLPPNIYRQIRSSGPYVDGLHRLIAQLKENGLKLPRDLIKMAPFDVVQGSAAVEGVSDIDRERFELAAAFYRHLHQKYDLDFIEIGNHIARLKTVAFPRLGTLEKALAEKDLEKKLYTLLDYLAFLKDLILSDRRYEIKEDIYKKRHFTVDIPSMYGSYHEMKFDALGLTFRLESIVNTLFEELIKNTDLSLITKATFFQIFDRLILFDKALKVEGIQSVELERQLEMLSHSLQVRGFTFTQYLDIFKGFAQAVKNIINDYFANIHGPNLNKILAKMPSDLLLEKYLPASGLRDKDKSQHRISEIFFRDRIALTTGLQQMDLYLSRILNTLFQQSTKLPKDKLHQLLLYDPQNAMTFIGDAEKRVSGIIHLGNKGLNLVKLKAFGLPVPPGFIITTEVFRCRDIIDSYLPAEENFKEQIQHHIAVMEKRTGRLFGSPKKPLLFSVRSGSSISQPGMMDTYLNVGVNENIAEGLAAVTGNAWFAWDNYRRFLQCYGMAFGLERDDFDAIISELKRRAGVEYKRDLTGMQMKKVALTYKNMLHDAGMNTFDDPLDQLYTAIKSVMASWESSKARTYRRIMGISDDWGTAVTVQAMVYGNIGEQSGAGVFFTHNPRWSEDSLRLWGDFTIGNQGEDVVSGLVRTLPISISQQEIEMRETDITLETFFPEIYNALKKWAVDLIEKRGWSPQEMEFTFEGPTVSDLYLLQTRDMAMRERKKVLTFELDGVDEGRLLGHGIGVSGGAMSGRMIFTLEEIDAWRKQEPDTPLILVRGDTVPDDIREIHAADGLLTARGGVSSHAAVVAHRLGKTGVVGCRQLLCDEKEKLCHFGDHRLVSGDFISIDGREGAVFKGRLMVGES